MWWHAVLGPVLKNHGFVMYRKLTSKLVFYPNELQNHYAGNVLRFDWFFWNHDIGRLDWGYYCLLKERTHEPNTCLKHLNYTQKSYIRAYSFACETKMGTANVNKKSRKTFLTRITLIFQKLNIFFFWPFICNNKNMNNMSFQRRIHISWKCNLW
jgi:hypothetical protein